MYKDSLAIAKFFKLIEVYKTIGGTATNVRTINEEKTKKPRGKAAKNLNEAVAS